MYWSTPLTLTAKFADLMGGVCRAVGVQAAWVRTAGPAMVELVFKRLTRMWTRLTTLTEAQRMGTLRPIAPRRPRPGRPRPALAADRPRLPPQRFGWLIRTVPEKHLLAFWRGPLEELLADPETIALAAAGPRAGRLLRPLCAMLAVDLPDYLKLPPRPRRPRPPRPPRVLTPEQRDAKFERRSRMAYAHWVNPEDEGEHDPRALRPPNRIGYGRQKRLIKRDPY